MYRGDFRTGTIFFRNEKDLRDVAPLGAGSLGETARA